MAKKCRSILWLLALSVLLGVLAGCSRGEDNPSAGTGTADGASSGDGETAAGENPEGQPPLRELPEMDFENYTFRILMRNSSVHQSDIFADESSGDAVDNAVFLRNEAVSERYNVQFELIASSSGNDDSDGIPVILSGTDAYDLVAPHGRRCITYAMNDCCVDWYSLPYLNLTYDWWAQGARNSFTFNDTLLFMTGDMSHLSVAASYVMMFNKDILTANEIAHPYDDVKNGSWTFEKMSEIALQCAQDMDGDDVCLLDSSTDVLGYATYPWGGTYCAFFASGSRILSRDENGMPIITIASETAYDALNDFFTLATSSSCHLDTDDSNAKLVSAMTGNRIVFHDCPLNDVVRNYRKTDLNYGIVPFPKTAEVEDYASHVAGSCNVFLIPRTSPDTGRTAVILEALCQEGSKSVIPVYYDSVVAGKSMRDEQSYEMLPIISASRLYDFGYYDIELPGMSNLMEQLAKKNRSAAEFYSMYNQRLNEAQEHLQELVALYSKY